MNYQDKTLIELEELKIEAYSRPERFPFERFQLVLAWTMKAMEEAMDSIKELQIND